MLRTIAQSLAKRSAWAGEFTRVCTCALSSSATGKDIKRQKKVELKPFDGNQAASYVAYHMSDTSFIYPITPSSAMGEYCDEMSTARIKNIFGQVTKITQMQSEAGAAGALHGAAAVGALTSTFTASQGLLLMLPNMYKIAGELLPSVLHVAARALSFQALSIFGDHSDVMACRQTGFALLASSTVQECMDLALVSHLASIKSKIPFLHFFEGFRLSHEVNSIEAILPETMKELIDKEALQNFRMRANIPEHGKALGHSQGPEAIFQTMEAANPYHNAVPNVVQDCMDDVAKATGRQYHLFDYAGAEDADRVIVVMGAGGPVVEEAVQYLNSQGQKVGVLKVRLYRPWSESKFLEILPKSVKRIAVLDRTKEPGSAGEPLFQDVVFSIQQSGKHKDIDIVGGRFGLASKEFNPAMAVAVFDNLNKEKPKNHFTLGIKDDVTFTSLEPSVVPDLIGKNAVQCVFYGLGSDGTVGSNKQAIKLMIEKAHKKGQAYFSYSADKSNALTRSYLRFGDHDVNHEYLIEHADYVACMRHDFVQKFDVLSNLKDGGMFVLNTPHTSLEALNKHLPAAAKRALANKNAKLFVIDAYKLADQCGLKGKYSQIMQTVFFHLTGILGSKDNFLPIIREITTKEFKKLGNEVIQKNIKGVDMAIDNVKQINIPEEWKNAVEDPECPSQIAAPADAPAAIKDVIIPAMYGRGDKLPVSKLGEVCLGGITPLGTTQYEKKFIADVIPVWDAENCAQCNLCAWNCPHSCIRPFVMTKEEAAAGKFDTSPLKPTRLKKGTLEKVKDMEYRIQVAPYECTSCGLCVASCPHNALEMNEYAKAGVEESTNFDYCMSLPDRSEFFEEEKNTIRGLQFTSPLIEYPASCQGCTETVIMKIVSQICGDRMTAANSSGCSSVWSGCFPRMPFKTNFRGAGPAWGRSLFEDTAEYGYGMAVGMEHRREGHYDRVAALLNSPVADKLPSDLKSTMKEWMENWQNGEQTGKISRKLIPMLYNCSEPALDGFKGVENDDLWVKKSHWCVGGDGWAYDIGYSGVDHVMSTGQDIKVLVFDNEIYGNTGAQKSKSTSRGASAKFAVSGKETPKKDLAAMAMTYDNVYVASIATATQKQAQQAQDIIREAEAFHGPALILAYCNCTQHHIKGGMGSGGLRAMKLAVESGYWPLFKWDPRLRQQGQKPFQLLSKPDFSKIDQYLETQGRFKVRKEMFPDLPDLTADLKEDIKKRWSYYDVLTNLN